MNSEILNNFCVCTSRTFCVVSGRSARFFLFLNTAALVWPRFWTTTSYCLIISSYHLVGERERGEVEHVSVAGVPGDAGGGLHGRAGGRGSGCGVGREHGQYEGVIKVAYGIREHLGVFVVLF